MKALFASVLLCLIEFTHIFQEAKSLKDKHCQACIKVCEI